MAEKEQSYLVEGETQLLPFLLASIKGKSRNNIKALLTRGQISVDGRTVTRHDHVLHKGQTVMIETVASVFSRLPFPILFEDREIIVIDKPAGLLSIATDDEREQTAYHMVTDYIKAKNPAGRIFIVHRLDRDTSGVLLFAKDETTKRSYQDNWEDLVAKRVYVAVTEGNPEEPDGTVHTWLQEKNYMVFSGRGTDGKEAITHYCTRIQNRNYSLLELDIATGRKNQIRVHMKDLGCPLVGDRKYGAQTNPIARLALHASELVLRHHKTGVEMRYFAPTPASFRSLFRPEGKSSPKEKKQRKTEK